MMARCKVEWTLLDKRIGKRKKITQKEAERRVGAKRAKRTREVICRAPDEPGENKRAWFRQTRNLEVWIEKVK
jgi:hypothetical protein